MRVCENRTVEREYVCQERERQRDLSIKCKMETCNRAEYGREIIMDCQNQDQNT